MPAQKASQTNEFSKAFSTLQLPSLSFDQLALSQRRNLETATAAAQRAAGSVQAAWQQQWEFFTQFLAQDPTDFQGLWSVGTPHEKVAQHVALAKSSVEKVAANAREIVDLLIKSSNEVTDLVTKRITESLTELQSVPAKA
jgi:phasin family protein